LKESYAAVVPQNVKTAIKHPKKHNVEPTDYFHAVDYTDNFHAFEPTDYFHDGCIGRLMKMM